MNPANENHPWKTNFHAAAGIIEDVLPEPAERRIILYDIANSILKAQTISRPGWNLRLDRGLIRFNTALLYMINIFDGWIGVTITSDCPYPSKADLILNGENHGGIILRDEFADKRFLHIVMPTGYYLNIREELLESHYAAVAMDLAPTKAGFQRRVHGTMAKAHSFAAVEYLSKALSIELPQPEYGQLEAPSGAKKSNADNTYSEGEELRRIAKEFRRDPQARESCLNYHGCRCVVCGFDFSAAYGSEFERLTQAHHLVPLSENPGNRITDPQNDMRPVCINCHAVIHSRKPAYSIAEVQEFLRKNGGQFLFSQIEREP